MSAQFVQLDGPSTDIANLHRPQPIFVQPTTITSHSVPNLSSYGTSNTLYTTPIETAVNMNVIHEFLPQMGMLLQQPVNTIINKTDDITNGHQMISSGEKDGEKNGNKKKVISPFAAEAIVPLPDQLNDMWTIGTTVHRRNQRERQRVRCVNDGYSRLKQSLPLLENEKRISKVDTLRLAIIYIHHLEQLVQNINHELECTCFLQFQPSGNVSN